MPRSPIVIASDHAGYDLKETLKNELESWGYQVDDLGAHGTESVDYPDFGHAAAEAIASGRADRGVIVCGTGIGISIAANRHPGVRAAVCHDSLTARLARLHNDAARLHNDANVLALGARVLGVETAKDCLKSFLDTAFEGGRHAKRVEKLG
jgi:ribose 5-phosphate isomerase B